MTFIHKLLPQLEVDVVSTPKGRYYKTEDGILLPSVTTVLGRMMDKTTLLKWKERVGTEEAFRISKTASMRGNMIHKAAEQFILNNPDAGKNLIFSEQHMFQELKPVLDKNVGVVYGNEMPLYSKALYTAGRTDLVAEWDGVPSLIDFKTSRYIKDEKTILSYFLQATCYAFMVSSIYGIKFNQIVILMVPIHEKPVVFVKNVKDYFEEMVSVFIKHKELYFNK